MKKYLSLVSILLFLISCQKEIVIPPNPLDDPVLEIKAKDYCLSCRDTTIGVALVTNCEYTVHIRATESNWLSLVGTKTTRNDTVWISAGYNEGYDRNTQVVIQGGNSEITLSDTITIHQRYNDDYHIPIQDEIFKKYLTDHFDADGDGEISCLETENIHKIDFHDLKVSSLEGVEYFRNLTYISCINGQLTELDLSHNVKLTDVWCNSNHITALNVNGCRNLTFLRCSGNDISSLDLSGVPSLEVLYCSINPLSYLDLSIQNELTQLTCEETLISSLDLRSNSRIRSVSCSGCPYLKTLSLPGGFMITVAKDEWTRLIWMDEDGKPVNIPEDDKLVSFEDPNFEKLLVSSFDYDGNGKISKTEAELIRQINCSQKEISIIGNLSLFSNLSILECGNNAIERLDVRNLSRLEWLECSHNKIASLDLSTCPLLKHLHCADNHLTELDLKSNPLLDFMAFYQNDISSIDFSENKQLKKLYCYSCQLTEMNLEVVPELELVWCDNNKLVTLDVSHNTKLQYLLCASNKLTELDVSSNPNLIYLSCRRNPEMTTIWMKEGQSIDRIFMDEWVAITYR